MMLDLSPLYGDTLFHVVTQADSGSRPVYWLLSPTYPCAWDGTKAVPCPICISTWLSVILFWLAHICSLMARKGHTSNPPSWSTLFPGLPHFPTTDLPQYSDVQSAIEVPLGEKTASSPSSRSGGSRYRLILTCVALFSSLCIVLVAAKLLLSPDDQGFQMLPSSAFESVNFDDGFDASHYVNGPPTLNYTDNLRADQQYITSFISAGWTNDVMTYANLIYLGLLTQRIPILPPFAPSHLSLEAGFPAFGDVFDVPRLAAAIRSPVLEWRDVKDINSTQVETMGCWSVWMGSGTDFGPRGGMVPGVLGLDISYTSIPDSYKMYPEYDNDPHVPLNRLMRLSFPGDRERALGQHQPLPAGSGIAMEPDDHLLCYDFLYYTGVDSMFEWEADWSPAWRFVGTHMHWAPKMEELALSYLKRRFDVPMEEDVPPYIAVHMRRGDFYWACENNDFACLPSLRQLQRRVLQIQTELFRQHGIYTERVLVMSDEKDPEWWQQVQDLGYARIDHDAERTVETYGLWLAPMLDAVFQSMASGFIGTDRSTFSLVAEKRVHDWNNGPVTKLMWAGVAAEEL